MLTLQFMVINRRSSRQEREHPSMFHRKLRVIVAVALTSALSLVIPAFQTEASAYASKALCAEPADHPNNVRQIVLPGGKEATFHVRVCLTEYLADPSPGWYTVVPTIYVWVGDGDNDWPTGNAFYDTEAIPPFTVQVRLEKSNVDQYHNYCGFPNIGPQYTSANPAHCNIPNSQVVYQTTNPTDLTADGKITYDVIGDGNGTITWSLDGSPAGQF